jgi:phosphoglycolate phosphatase
MTYTAILFDLDGTLLDTLEDLADSMNVVLESRGMPLHALDAYRYFVGNGMEVFVQRCMPKAILPDKTLVKDIETQMRAEYARRLNNKTHLYDGIAQMLDELQRRKVRLSVLSNKPHDAVLGVMEHYFGAWKFDAIYGDRPGIPTKPDPGSALQIAREMKLLPSDFLYLGDTSTDMETAVAAGMYPVGVTWGFRTAEEIRKAGARSLINKPREVLELL